MDEPTVTYRHESGATCQVSPADAEALDRDQFLHGNAFVIVDSDGVGHRVAPDVISEAKQP